MATPEDSTPPTAEVGLVPEEIRTLLADRPRPWRFDGHSISDADGGKIGWSPDAMVLAIQAINAFDVERQWKPTD